LDIIIIPKFGIADAALASSVAYIVATIFAFVCFVKMSKVRISNIFVPMPSDFRYALAFLRNIK